SALPASRHQADGELRPYQGPLLPEPPLDQPDRHRAQRADRGFRRAGRLGSDCHHCGFFTVASLSRWSTMSAVLTLTTCGFSPRRVCSISRRLSTVASFTLTMPVAFLIPG